MEPLATFEEQRLAGKRLYRLFPDRISITGKEYFGSEYEMTVNLGSLDIAVNRVTAREPLFRHGLYLMVGSVIANEVLVRGLKVEQFASVSGLALTLAFTGLILMLATWRQREWVIFKSLQGQQLASISCVLSQRPRLDLFLKAVRAQTLSCQNVGSAQNPDGQA